MARSGLVPPAFDVGMWARGHALGRELIVIWELTGAARRWTERNPRLRPLELSALFTHNVEGARFDEVCDMVRAPWRGY